MSLIREVNPETRQKGTLFAFSTVYPDNRRGGYRMKDLGQTCSGRRGSDDDITLQARKFQIGDFINPRRMREGYGSRSVCVSVTAPAATYLFYTSKTRCH